MISFNFFQQFSIYSQEIVFEKNYNEFPFQLEKTQMREIFSLHHSI